MIRPRSLRPNFAVTEPLLATIHHLLQKCTDFVAIQQRFTNGNSVHEIFRLYLVRHSYAEFFFNSIFFLSKQCLHNDSTIFIVLSTFSTIGLPERGSSFTSKLPQWKWRNRNCIVLGPWTRFTFLAIWVKFSPLSKNKSEARRFFRFSSGPLSLSSCL